MSQNARQSVDESAGAVTFSTPVRISAGQKFNLRVENTGSTSISTVSLSTVRAVLINTSWKGPAALTDHTVGPS